MMKKILSLALLAGLFVSAGFATYSESSWSTSYPGTFNFKASYTDGKVAMTWNKFTVPSGKSFAYYKVIRSQTKESPVYPEDGYITYNSDLSFTSYADENPLQGKTYYRVCAILDGQKRYCSNVVKVTITSTQSSSSETEEEKQPEVKKETPKTTSDGLTSDSKKQLDEIATAFLAKVNAKYGTTGDARTQFIANIIIQLNSLAKNTKMKPMISYLIAKLQPTTNPLDEIKSILKVE